MMRQDFPGTPAEDMTCGLKNRIREDLWEVEFVMADPPSYTFGYFDDEVQAMLFAEKVLRSDLLSLQDSFLSGCLDLRKDEKVLIRPNNIMAVEIAHPSQSDVDGSWWDEKA